MIRGSRAFVLQASRRHLGAAAGGGMEDYKKITAQITKQAVGIQFPADSKGARSTTNGSKRVVAAALRGAGVAEGEALAKEVEAEKDWRFGYSKHFMNLVRLSARSPAIALKVSKAGLDFAADNFEFVEADGKVSKFSDYMADAHSKGSFHSHVIRGTGTNPSSPLYLSYKGERLEGERMRQQIKEWADYGTVEPDISESIDAISEGKIDLTGKHFVLIGAGSAMGPLHTLLEHGATVVCIDMPGKWGERPTGTWKRIIAAAKKSPGTIIIPSSQAQVKDEDELVQTAGCNLTEQPAEILNWLSGIAKNEKLTIGNYAYLDGELFVRVTVATDAILKALCQQRKDTNLAFLGTPTDIHAISEDAFNNADANYKFHQQRVVEKIVKSVSKGGYLNKNELPPVICDDGSNIKLVDAVNILQGPNYLLAKRLQHFRCMVEYDQGHLVSSDIAPATRTMSVLSNEKFGWALNGMQYFKPYEIFDQDTSNTLMANLLISNVLWKESSANPANRERLGIKNPVEMFKFNSAHGGTWRCGYRMDSIQELSVIIHKLGGPQNFLKVANASLALLGAGTYAALLKLFGAI